MQGLLDSRFLSSARIQRIVEVAASELERMRPLTFLNRLKEVNATDDELMGRFTARPIAADIIADGQAANTYDGGKIELILNSLANIKVGRDLDQRMLNLLAKLTKTNGYAEEEDAYFRWETQIGEAVLMGVKERENAMACAMMLDSFSYNQWGVKLTGATWGMPANLKVTPAQLWSSDGGSTTNASADPINDIFKLDEVDAVNYGLGAFDRVTLSSKAFMLMTQNTNVANKAWIGLGMSTAFIPTVASLSSYNRTEMKEIIGKVLKKEIVIDDKVLRIQNPDGTFTTSRVLPENKVLLDRTTNGPREMDWGNGVVTESIVSGILGGPVLGESPTLDLNGQYGPLAYYTAKNVTLNPPGVIAWGVARGFPRKHIPESTAVLTVY